MQEHFSIFIEETVPEDNVLCMQVSNTSFCFCISNPESGKLLQLKRYTFPALKLEILEAVLEKNPVLAGSFQKINTSLDFGFSTLLPAEMADADVEPLMYLENADQQDHVITEFITEKGVANIFAVSPGVLTWLVHNFPRAAYWHAHTVAIKSIEEPGTQGLLKVDIAENRFTVVALKQGALLLAKSYSYLSGADVVFYLLKISETFGFKQHEVLVQLSGLIEAHSTLYQALYDYFLNISFKAAAWADAGSDHPSHYFTALKELATCELFQEAWEEEK